MSADAVGRHMPAIATLDDLAAMMAADPHGHRYELSPEGVLSIMPPADGEHALIATRIMAWLLAAGWPVDQIAQAVGLAIPGAEGVSGGRIPDLVVWGEPPADPRQVWLPVANVLLVVEIVSRGSEAVDKAAKPLEYAGAGIPQYWTVDRDAGQTVTMYRLARDRYEMRAATPLAWVLNTSVTDHLGI
ncbi:Uma2 family endonuclease [Dactylosporangium sp. CA-139114]|uniref:Uma2 family endonuclease n=1 Tax=Dactylosporangium sp. CA-139114 TaxID=3239931 RepID=UPI003D964B25